MRLPALESAILALILARSDTRVRLHVVFRCIKDGNGALRRSARAVLVRVHTSAAEAAAAVWRNLADAMAWPDACNSHVALVQVGCHSRAAADNVSSAI